MQHMAFHGGAWYWMSGGTSQTVTESPLSASAVREIATCRSCGSTRLEEVLALGELYVSGFLEANGEGHKAPLVLVRCVECTLVQLRHTVPSAWHYEGGYWYRSGTNEQMVAQLRDVVDDTLARVDLRKGDSVIDVGCNDGTMLKMFPHWTRRFGFEPDINLARMVNDAKIHVFVDFFPSIYATAIRDAKVICAIAMFYDLDDPNVFVSAVKDWLAPDGLFLIQMAYAPAMLQTNDIGNVSHEHLEYYTVRSLAHLLNRHGLMIEDVSFNDVNGGSFRVFIRHGQGGIQDDPPNTELDWRDFATRANMNRHHTVEMLRLLRAERKTVAGYGASTRGNTLLQFYGIGPDLLPYIADRNPAKWGKRTVGSNIPIISEDEMRARRPDMLFCLPFHLIESFKRREPDYIGRFIVPLPTPHVQ